MATRLGEAFRYLGGVQTRETPRGNRLRRSHRWFGPWNTPTRSRNDGHDRWLAVRANDELARQHDRRRASRNPTPVKA